ncbi:20281_t:CDS:2 [Rhizophagus irregularis]|nr:20281_t:CDS:2 [Rhizophagus irregularis]
MLRLNVDCLVLIFDELQDKESLYSCLLVNREWCRLVVPILWKNYSWCNVDEFNFFNTILSWLSTSSKKILSDNDIKLPSTTLLKPPLFNYISFCRFPETEIINRMIEMVLEKQNDNNKRNILEQEIYKLFISQCKNVKEFVWRTSQPLSLFPGASKCFSQLYRLTIDLDYINSNSLNEMAKILNTIIPPSFLTSLVNLTWILVYNDEQYEDLEKIKEFQKYLAISEYPDLRSLNITGLLCFKELSMLIEKTKGNISRIYIYTINIANRAATNTGMLIKSIAKNCPKIKFLRTYLEPEDFIHVKSLLLNCRNLEDISFDNINFIINENDDDVGDELLNILTKFSPKSLTHITISGSWKYSLDSFERFFAIVYKDERLYDGFGSYKI